jgi:HEPN domain-containing protein
MSTKLPRDIDPQAWFEQAARRYTLAKVAWEKEGFTSEAIELLQESAERYLKGYLLSTGWKLIKTHDLKTLIDSAREKDARFGTFAEWAETLTNDFFIAHYPMGDEQELKQDYQPLQQQTDNLIILIKELLPQYFQS